MFYVADSQSTVYSLQSTVQSGWQPVILSFIVYSYKGSLLLDSILSAVIQLVILDCEFSGTLEMFVQCTT